MRKSEIRKIKNIPPIDVHSQEYLTWLMNLRQVRIPDSLRQPFYRHYVNGTRIVFHIDGSEGIVMSSYYCVNMNADGTLKLALVHLVKYLDGDDDGIHDSDLYGAAFLYRCTYPVSFPWDWEWQMEDRLIQRDLLMEKYQINNEYSTADNR